MVQLPEHYRSVKCEQIFVFFQEALLSLVRVYARLVLSQASNTGESEEADEANKVFPEKMAAIASKRRLDS